MQSHKLGAACDLFKALCDELAGTIPLRQVLAFLAVARRVRVDGEADLRDIAKDIGASSAVTSRDLLVLSMRGRNGRDGYDLIAVRQDLKDLRRRPYVLTAKGAALAEKLFGAPSHAMDAAIPAQRRA